MIRDQSDGGYTLPRNWLPKWAEGKGSLKLVIKVKAKDLISTYLALRSVTPRCTALVKFFSFPVYPNIWFKNCWDT